MINKILWDMISDLGILFQKSGMCEILLFDSLQSHAFKTEVLIYQVMAW